MYRCCQSVNGGQVHERTWGKQVQFTPCTKLTLSVYRSISASYPN